MRFDRYSSLWITSLFLYAKSISSGRRRRREEKKNENEEEHFVTDRANRTGVTYHRMLHFNIERR